MLIGETILNRPIDSSQPSLFARGGITDPKTANLATGGVGIVLFVFAWFPIFFFDRLGRKTWLQIGLVGMAGAMVGITVLQWHAENHPGDRANYAIVAFPYLFYVFFNISWGVGSWTYATEIFPVMYRAKGNALSTMTLWMACYIVAQVSPPIASAIGWGLYIIYSGICVIAFIFVRYAMGELFEITPYCSDLLIRGQVETRGRTLEEMSALFGIESTLAQRSGMETSPKAGLVHHTEVAGDDDES